MEAAKVYKNRYQDTAMRFNGFCHLFGVWKMTLKCLFMCVMIAMQTDVFFPNKHNWDVRWGLFCAPADVCLSQGN